MLFIGKLSFALLITNISTIFMTISVWFWTDINFELAEYQTWHPLSVSTKIWRWSLTLVSIIFLCQSLSNITCTYSILSSSCLNWLEPSEKLYLILKNLFNFFFGAKFSEPIAKFFGLLTLFIYTLGLLQWLVIKLPKSGRNSGFSNYNEY